MRKFHPPYSHLSRKLNYTVFRLTSPTHVIPTMIRGDGFSVLRVVLSPLCSQCLFFLFGESDKAFLFFLVEGRGSSGLLIFGRGVGARSTPTPGVIRCPSPVISAIKFRSGRF